MFGSFPVKNRRDAALVDFFKESGVPETQVVYLQDKQATQQQIDSAFSATLKKLRSDDLLIVYYCGHGSKSDEGNDVFLASHDAGDDDVEGWSVNSIPGKIKSESKCARVLWLIDCCYSGQAAVALTKQKGRPAYACVTSSSASESSTEHWTFSDALLDSLRGVAYVDLNHDGAVTLAEFASHLYRGHEPRGGAALDFRHHGRVRAGTGPGARQNPGPSENRRAGKGAGRLRRLVCRPDHRSPRREIENPLHRLRG